MSEEVLYEWVEHFNDKMDALAKNEPFLHVCGGCGFYISGIQPKGTRLYCLCSMNCKGRIMQQILPAKLYPKSHTS